MGGAEVRTETGCTVLAVVRGGRTITDFDPSALEIEPGDEVVVAGTDGAITRFEGAYG